MKISGLALFNITLAILLLACSLWVSTTADYGTLAVPPYDPWCDLNDDGKIDIRDVAEVARRFGAIAEPGESFVTKAGLEYDSGWVNITDKAGQYFTLVHDLNTTEALVDVVGRPNLTSGDHKLFFGTTMYIQGWNETYGGVDIDLAYSLAQTSDGGYAIAGATGSFCDDGSDFWLVKADSTGNMEWNKTYDRDYWDMAYCVVETSDGGYAIAGWFSPQQPEVSGWWLVKTDSTGNMEWNKTYGGTYAGRAFSVVQTGDGGYAIAGDGFAELVKIDADGDLQWNKTYDETYGCRAWSVVQTSDAGYAIAGDFWTLGEETDFWLAKTDANGDMQWNKTYGGPNGDAGFSVVQTDDGGYAMAGFGFANLVKTGADGNLQWGKTYGGLARSLVQTTDGGYALAGQIYFETNSYFGLVKTDSTGNVQWNKKYGAGSGDAAYSIVQTFDGGYVLAGSTTSQGGDFWLVKAGVELGFTIGLSMTDLTNTIITFYRGRTDPYWNYVRVRIWKIKENP